ncbi:MAG: FkbM family methyltransferase [Candidatus Goldbacteria bacterium]|nr:FkbM family methyltransferase [Candidatus Goldiibacteriota bacterium]
MKNKLIKTLAFLTRNLPYIKGEKRIWRLIYNPDKRQNDYIETIIPYDKNLKIHINTSSFIEWDIFVSGYYEPHIVKLIKKYLKKDDVFVDVGANIGCHTLIAAKICKKVIAIEPEPNVRNRLIQNIKLNNLKNVIVYDYAISDYVGEGNLYPPLDDNSHKGLSCLIYKNDLNLKNESIKVKVITLDELLKNEEKINFIKIDIESFNRTAIFGAKNIIKKFNPIVLYERDGTDIMQFF